MRPSINSHDGAGKWHLSHLKVYSRSWQKPLNVRRAFRGYSTGHFILLIHSLLSSICAFQTVAHLFSWLLLPFIVVVVLIFLLELPQFDLPKTTWRTKTENWHGIVPLMLLNMLVAWTILVRETSSVETSAADMWWSSLDDKESILLLWYNSFVSCSCGCQRQLENASCETFLGASFVHAWWHQIKQK